MKYKDFEEFQLTLDEGANLKTALDKASQENKFPPEINLRNLHATRGGNTILNQYKLFEGDLIILS